MATAPETSLQMSPADLIKKEPLDYGGFGEVYLCYHVTLGHVVLKTMYTGPLRNEDSKRSLLEEGSIMASLNHERVVKLLGVIMEDRDYSLVMELLPRGNLLVMLETVSVPVSIKGRIILEILEGMVYLTEKNVIHKDIKPENILVDKDFHIKIADLGLATCQTWSKLTKQESRRRSRRDLTVGMRGAGTLNYMAPEHLRSIHTPSSEKSDVYSFAIVVWVILTGQEPYPNARSEEHVSQCVCNGDRPAENLIPEDTPVEIIQLMKRCWDPNPEQRPTFKGAYNSFLPFYMETLEPHVENDICKVKVEYEGPDELVEKVKSLSMTHECSLTSEHDQPAPLVSSDKSVSMPVEASIEDLHVIHYEPCGDSLQPDARVLSTPSGVEEKLDRELQYHKHGNYLCDAQPEAANCFHRHGSNPFLPNYLNDNIGRQPAQDMSSVQSWTKGEPAPIISQEDVWPHPTSELYESMRSSSPHWPTSVSTPSLSPFNPQHPHTSFDRQKSWPTCPVPDTAAPNTTSGRLLTSTTCSSLQDPGSLYIQNASGIQIGFNNTMSIRGCEASINSLSQCNGSPTSQIQEGICDHDRCPVNDKHLDLVRNNIGNKWKRCARGLNLTNVEIETIEHDYSRDGLPEMVHQMLESWKMKEGSFGCTIGNLCRALDGNIKVDVIQNILDLCNSCSPKT